MLVKVRVAVNHFLVQAVSLNSTPLFYMAFSYT